MMTLTNYSNYNNNQLDSKNLIDNLKNSLSNIDDISYNQLKIIISKLVNQLELHIIELEDITYNKNVNVNNKKYMELKNNYINLNKASAKTIDNLKKQIEELKEKTQAHTNTCCVCLTETSNYANSKCGHLCVCETCSYHLDDKCPICRADGVFIKIICS
jgi:TRAP-type mannitol/chloroaromatic compound transport system substrate-binding protein